MDTTQQDEADTVTSHPEEKNESEDGNGEDEDEKSLDNGVQDMLDFLASTNFESSPYDFDGSVQGIENSKLAEKLKDKFIKMTSLAFSRPHFEKQEPEKEVN